MSIFRRIMLSSVIMICFFSISIFFTFNQILNIRNDLKQIVEVEEPLEQAILEIKISALGIFKSTIDYTREHDKLHLNNIKKYSNNFEEYINILDKYDQDHEIILEIKDYYRNIISISASMVKSVDQSSNELNTLEEYINDINILTHELQKTIKEDTPSAIKKLGATFDIESNVETYFSKIKTYVFYRPISLLKEIYEAEADFKLFQETYLENNDYYVKNSIVKKLESKFNNVQEISESIIENENNLVNLKDRFEEILDKLEDLTDQNLQPYISASTLRKENIAKGNMTKSLILVSILFISGILISLYLIYELYRDFSQSLQSIETGINNIENKNFDIRLPVLKNNEFSKITNAFNQMIDDLKTNENKKNEYIQNRIEDERIKMARSIHEDLGQRLSTIKIILNYLDKSDKLLDNEDYLKIKDALKLTDESIYITRKISTELRPRLLDDLGLIAAIEWQSEEFEKRSGIKIKIETKHDYIELEQVTATNLFRVYQEILSNIAKHSHASQVYVKLYLKDKKIHFLVEDNGKGISNKSLNNRSSLGITTMLERIKSINGILNFETKEGNGTIIEIIIPFEKALKG